MAKYITLDRPFQDIIITGMEHQGVYSSFDTEAYLVREPDNQFDPKAIAVYNSRGKKIAYVAKIALFRDDLVKMLDEGKKIEGRACGVRCIDGWATRIFRTAIPELMGRDK